MLTPEQFQSIQQRLAITGPPDTTGNPGPLDWYSLDIGRLLQHITEQEAQTAAYRDALQRIAYTSSNPGNQGNELTHAERWLEKAAWAREALDSTTAGQALLDRQRELEKALKPFALVGEVIAYPDMVRMVAERNDRRSVAVYALDFRRATALLEQKGVEPG